MSQPVPSDLNHVADDLREKISKGSFAVGELLPTMKELAKSYQCSMGMVSKALMILISEGIVEQRKGVGTRVIRNSLQEESRSVQLDAFAFIYPSDHHEGIANISAGFQAAARDAGRRVVMMSTGTDFRQEAEIVGRLSEFDVKGCVVYPVLPELADRLYFAQMLKSCRFPVVLAEIAMPGFGAPCIMLDGFHAGYTMTRYLLDKGLKKIGFISNYAWVPSYQDRFKGYCWAMEEAGLSWQEQWVLLDPELRPEMENPLDAEWPAAVNFLKGGRDLEGLVCADDFLARKCLSIASDLNINIPGDLLVTGISDYAVAAASSPALTTYQIPYHELGRQSFLMLNSMVSSIDQQESPHRQDLMLRGKVIIRQTA